MALQHHIPRHETWQRFTLPIDQLAAAAGLGLGFVPGVEVSVTWQGGTVHILGLGVDPASEELRRGLAKLRAHRDWRAEEIGRRLAKEGIDGAFEGARERSNGRLISRTHFARFLVDGGHARDTGGAQRVVGSSGGRLHGSCSFHGRCLNAVSFQCATMARSLHRSFVMQAKTRRSVCPNRRKMHCNGAASDPEQESCAMRERRMMRAGRLPGRP